ncbi:MAG: hypothetical protein RL077_2382 [Verrucomicrobiota bacterium]|jgi:uncharacterized protein (DUF1684 family)
MEARFCLAVRWLLMMMVAGSGWAADRGDVLREEIALWQQRRVAELTAVDGWLTLVGLHFMKEGDNTVGSAADNDIVLAKSPARVGTIQVAAGGKVSLVCAAGTDVRVDGAVVGAAELKWAEPKKPTLVTTGSLTFFVVDRGGKKALRVKDRAAESRARFVGLDYFATDPTWRREARWQPFEKSRLMPIKNMLGQTEMELVPGKAVFTHEGRLVELLAIDEGRDVPLFFVVADETNGKETYGGGRFLYVEWPQEGATTIILDFNRMENPPCAFTAFSTCPLPPKENRLPFTVRAGEQSYRGAH